MDPKMDSGCVAAEELVDNDQQITRSLLPAEIIGIIDQLLCLEVCNSKRRSCSVPCLLFSGF